MARQDGADAVDERISRSEHADLPLALSQDLVNGAIERRGPWARRATNQRDRQGQMPLAAEYYFGVSDQPARHRAEPINAILADADDGQPAPRCGTLRRNWINE